MNGGIEIVLPWVGVGSGARFAVRDERAFQR